MLIDEVAERLGISTSQVRRLIRVGGPSVDGGRVKLEATERRYHSGRVFYEVSEEQIAAFVPKWSRKKGNPKFGKEIVGKGRPRKVKDPDQ